MDWWFSSKNSCFIQFIISLLNIKEKQDLGATRFEGFNILEFPSILINDVTIKSTLGDIGLNFFLSIIRFLSKSLSLDHHLIYWIFFLGIILGTCLIFKKRKEIDNNIILIIFSFITVSLLTYFSVSSSSSLLDRHAFVPAVIFISLIFFVLKYIKGTKIIIIASIYFVIALYEFYQFDAVYYSDSWPTWSNEVEKWHGDNLYQPKVWPRNNEHWSFLTERDWRVTLPSE